MKTIKIPDHAREYVEYIGFLSNGLCGRIAFDDNFKSIDDVLSKDEVYGFLAQGTLFLDYVVNHKYTKEQMEEAGFLKLVSIKKQVQISYAETIRTI